MASVFKNTTTIQPDLDSIKSEEVSTEKKLTPLQRLFTVIIVVVFLWILIVAAAVFV